MSEKEFIEELKKLNIFVDNNILSKLNKYYELLIDYNNHTNLTRITDKKEVYLKHFYDSLTICRVINLNQQKLLDVGTGAGFPGMVLKIVFPNLDVTLLDSLTKRIVFLEKVKKELKLDNLTIINARAEDYVINKREYYDIVTSRAVARLNVLTELCFPYVKLNGLFIPLKSLLEEELIEAANSIDVLGGDLIKNEVFKLPNEGGKRLILVIEKIKNTSVKYPRKFSEIKRKPL